MKERPMLMTPENAQKCHDGTKTMTRRIVKLIRDRGTWAPFLFEGSKCRTSDGKPGTDMACISNEKTGATIACPFWQVGERLWIRETHAWPGEEAYLFRGNPEHNALVQKWRADQNYPQIKWTPPIHMKREACRTVLEIVSVKVERLQEITEEDAIAEGVEALEKTAPHCHQFYKSYRLSGDGSFCEHTAVESFMTLWESINGPGSWGLNPWVWVIAFKKVVA